MTTDLTIDTLADAPPLATRRSFPGDSLMLIAVGLVVALVSFPLLADFTVRTNEVDARRALWTLADVVFADAGRPHDSLVHTFEERRDLRHRLADARPCANSRALLFHGYCFELHEGPEGAMLLAWPRKAGRTGQLAFALTSEGRFLGHPNSALTWSGPEKPPSGWVPGLSVDTGWRSIEHLRPPQ